MVALAIPPAPPPPHLPILGHHRHRCYLIPIFNPHHSRHNHHITSTSTPTQHQHPHHTSSGSGGSPMYHAGPTGGMAMVPVPYMTLPPGISPGAAAQMMGMPPFMYNAQMLGGMMAYYVGSSLALAHAAPGLTLCRSVPLASEYDPSRVCESSFVCRQCAWPFSQSTSLTNCVDRDPPFDSCLSTVNGKICKTCFGPRAIF